MVRAEAAAISNVPHVQWGLLTGATYRRKACCRFVDGGSAASIHLREGHGTMPAKKATASKSSKPKKAGTQARRPKGGAEKPSEAPEGSRAGK